MAQSITNMDDVIQVSDITDRIDELESMQTDCIAAGYNPADRMPDNEPMQFEDFEEAKAYILAVVENNIEGFRNGHVNVETGSGITSIAAMEAFKTQIEALPDDEEFSLHGPDGFVYWTTDTLEKMGLDDEEKAELKALHEFMEEMEGCGGDEQWRGNWYPSSAIRDSYFEDAMDELLEDIGDIPKNLPCYLYITVDYKALQMDYSSAEFEGITYYFR